MTHVSLKIARQKRNHQQVPEKIQRVRRLWLRVVRWLGRLPAAYKRQRRQKRSHSKHSLHQLTDHELKDIGLSRNFPGNNFPDRPPSCHYGESEYLHKGLRDLQYDLIRYLPRER